MAHDLDVMPVGIEQKGPVVVFVIVRARARGTVVFSARRESRLIERIDLSVSIGPEGEVNAGLIGCAFRGPKIRLGLTP